MAILRISVNDREVARAGGERYCSLHWDIRASLFEKELATIDVSGLAEREPAVYDAAYWLEAFPLKPGDRISVECSSDGSASPPLRWHTHEENEALRVEVARAEAAGEYDEQRASPRPRQRTKAVLRLFVPSGSWIAEAGADGDTVVCSGVWSNHHRTDEWRVRLAGVGANAKREPGKWLPVKSRVSIEIAA
jgi:hypothetical protein